MSGNKIINTVDGRNPAPVDRFRFLQGSIHARWLAGFLPSTICLKLPCFGVHHFVGLVVTQQRCVFYAPFSKDNRFLLHWASESEQIWEGAPWLVAARVDNMGSQLRPVLYIVHIQVDIQKISYTKTGSGRAMMGLKILCFVTFCSYRHQMLMRDIRVDVREFTNNM